MDFNLNKHIKFLLEEYLRIFPEESQKLELLKEQIENNEDIGDRKNFNGHLTAGAFILSNDKTKYISIKNIALNKWLIPGGHYEKGDDEIYKNALREAKEETGLDEIEILDWHIKNNFIPIDINTHSIPENIKKNEKIHFHHDFKYVFLLKNNQNTNLQLNEINGLKWLDINKEIENFSGKEVFLKLRNFI